MKIFYFILFVFVFSKLTAQDYTITEKFDLPNEVIETSGLIFFNNRLITHNDNSDEANLYELDSLSGSIIRTVNISNATNVDWEDITHDETYIYVGDIGNNDGSRTDLKIYRISKTDFEENTSVLADVISFSYEDQTDFTPANNNTNWDAESITVWGDKLFVFTKNWIDNETNLYVFPKIPGDYSATKESTFNSEGLITAATTMSDSGIFLIGYTDYLVPFFIVIDDINLDSDYDIFENSNQLKYNAFLPLGNQIEGVCFVYESEEKQHLFISNEEFSYGSTTFTQKLRAIDFYYPSLGSTTLENEIFNVYPNPTSDVIYVSKEFKNNKFKILSTTGLCIKKGDVNQNFIDVASLEQGVYYLYLANTKSISKPYKFIKK